MLPNFSCILIIELFELKTVQTLHFTLVLWTTSHDLTACSLETSALRCMCMIMESMTTRHKPVITWASNVPMQQRRLMESWDALGEALQQVERGEHWWGHSKSAVCSCGPPCTRDTDTLECPTQGYRSDGRTGACLLQWEAERAGTMQPGEEEAPGDLINVYKYLKVECERRKEPNTCQCCLSIAKGNKHEHQTPEAPPEHQEALLCCADGWALTQAAQRVGESLLGDLQKSLGHGPGHSGLGASAWAEVRSDRPRSPCQPQLLWDSRIQWRLNVGLHFECSGC